MVDPLDHPVFERAADAQVVEDGKMLDVLAEADAAGVWADRHAELGCHQDDRQDLVHASDTAGVDLAHVDRSRLEELLEEDSVLDVLPGGDADRRDGLTDPGMSEDVVRARRFLDPPGVELAKRTHRADRFVDAPDLVCVHHQLPVGPSTSRIDAARRASEPMSPPIFIFTCSKPSAIAAATSSFTFSSL